ncbi:DUF6660 family protein [Flavobacterium sp. NRK1]|uniref:DUF6660 family protein n=1 Tax=Flavobacterium sp. NRK1 TaxID=2954929 RepID=UPI0027E24CB5|nr:DUF6660 family protein [Flavobacterium sp. NRK1]
MQNLKQIATYFLSVYLLVLMVFPCSDAHTKNVVLKHSQIEQSHAGHHDDIEICTPFCVCGSCVAAVIVHSPFDITFFIPVPTSFQEPVFYQSLQSLFKGSIWQPPQLV